MLSRRQKAAVNTNIWEIKQISTNYVMEEKHYH